MNPRFHSSTILQHGRFLFLSGSDRKLLVWDIAKQKEFAKLDVSVDSLTSAAISPDGKFISYAVMRKEKIEMN